MPGGESPEVQRGEMPRVSAGHSRGRVLGAGPSAALCSVRWVQLVISEPGWTPWLCPSCLVGPSPRLGTVPGAVRGGEGTENA